MSALRVHNYGGNILNNRAMHFIGDVPAATNTILTKPAGKPQPVAAEKIEMTLKAGQTLVITVS